MLAEIFRKIISATNILAPFVPNRVYGAINWSVYTPLLKYDHSYVPIMSRMAQIHCLHAPLKGSDPLNGEDRCPRRVVWLGMLPSEQDLRYVMDPRETRPVESRVRVVMTLLSDWEIEYLPEALREDKIQLENGDKLRWWNIVVEDRYAPDAQKMAEHALRIIEVMKTEDRAAYIHCRYGRGRSVTMTALVLLLMDDAFANRRRFPEKMTMQEALRSVGRQSAQSQSVNSNQIKALRNAMKHLNDTNSWPSGEQHPLDE